MRWWLAESATFVCAIPHASVAHRCVTAYGHGLIDYLKLGNHESRLGCNSVCMRRLAATVSTNDTLSLQCRDTASDVSLSDGTIRVNKQLDRYVAWEVDAPMAIRLPKHNLKRQVRAWTKIRADLRFLVNHAGEDGLLIPRIGSASLWADAWAKRLDKARESINWTWTQHYLRHHYGSYTTASRADGGLAQSYAAVQSWMGHQQLETTMRTHIHDVSAATGWIQ